MLLPISLHRPTDEQIWAAINKVAESYCPYFHGPPSPLKKEKEKKLRSTRQSERDMVGQVHPHLCPIHHLNIINK